MAHTRNSKVESGNGKGERLRSSLSPVPRPLSPPRGISLIEVLISMFVLLFGLMGVAAIFPVASHYIQEGDKRDRSSGLAQIAFEELKSKKLLRPTTWAIPSTPNFSYPFLSSGQFTLAAMQGHAFIIDPVGTAAANRITPPPNGYDFLPVNAFNGQNPWSNPPSPQKALTGITWPIRRITFDVNSNPNTVTAMSAQTSEAVFTLHDELATIQPEAGDRPSVQLWRRDGSGQMLSRQFGGNYSWLATVVPTRTTALTGLQPAAGIRDEFYEITSVVLYKRNPTPSVTVGSSAGSERLVCAEFLNNGELALYNDASTVDTVDTALDGIKPTNWIAVCGVNQVNGAFMLKWYKILAMDDSSSQDILTGAGTRTVRYLMVDGPEWPTGMNGSNPLGWQNLRAIVIPGAIDAYTQVMQLTNNISFGDNEPPFMAVWGQSR
jgi:Tfp pilus assembly protein PilV